ncbi:hypothetical protein B0H15DRAFT_962385 [Mycena belliarum]|uniref:Alpha-type protein kinase domain-containing protein n=1 Tax=Mycena belliarum TaxID=1033014 RepID=A0AAD6TRV6_9AGAR|nr:hypothetical protein B0H15DRAFT_962385 [Mycena belliae]
MTELQPRNPMAAAKPLPHISCPTKYNIIIRLWPFASHKLLESLRRASSTSPLAHKHLQDFIHYAYAFYTGIPLNPFESGWLEALGNLARYKMSVAAMVVSGADSGVALTADTVPELICSQSPLFPHLPPEIGNSPSPSIGYFLDDIPHDVRTKPLVSSVLAAESSVAGSYQQHGHDHKCLEGATRLVNSQAEAYTHIPVPVCRGPGTLVVVALSLPSLEPSMFGHSAPISIDNSDSGRPPSARSQWPAVKVRNAEDDKVPSGSGPISNVSVIVAVTEREIKEKVLSLRKKQGGKRKRKDLDDADATYPAKRATRTRGKVVNGSLCECAWVAVTCGWLEPPAVSSTLTAIITYCALFLCDGCGGTFPKKTESGLCHRCHALENIGHGDMTALQMIPQCLDCGKIGKNISNSKCVTCVRQAIMILSMFEDAEAKTLQNAQNVRTSASLVRTEAWKNRTGSQMPRDAPPAPSPARNLATRDNRYINVHTTPYLLGKKNKTSYTRMGSLSRAYKESFHFEEMVEDTMHSWGPAWDAVHNASLIRSEITVFWHNNLALQPGSSDGTLGNFYDIHSQLYNSPVFLKVPAKFKGAVKEPAIVLSFFIDIDAFNERTGSRSMQATVVKRRRTDDDSDEPLAKRTALQSIPLTSNYIGLKVPAKNARSTTTVELQFVSAKTAGGNVSMFPWLGAESVTGRLSNEALQTGKDMAVFELEIDNVLYVAKRCRTVATDSDSLMEHTRTLLGVIANLWETKQMLESFYAAADDVDSLGDVDSQLAVHDTFFAVELVSAEHPPSVASGFSAETLKAMQEGIEPEPELEHQICWLIQRRTGNVCERWNLMNSDKLPDARGKLGTTLAAFSHFLATSMARNVEWNASKIHLLSHFQTASGRLPHQKGFGKLIIDANFQNSIRSAPKARALDIGRNGVKMVLDAHVCNRICDILLLTEEDEKEKTDLDQDDDIAQ